ncbi:hypothetical protein MLD38_032536 [Melastoma candidum]|uniref:Uncharacterized protein n=1 Tax=Melastoma candidum TaxID=119954 RepID=A0ACB9M6C6_9MYRT|nr:hypothetical protein MLD38_032536 [Melastoma candidum]
MAAVSLPSLRLPSVYPPKPFRAAAVFPLSTPLRLRIHLHVKSISCPPSSAVLLPRRARVAPPLVAASSAVDTEDEEELRDDGEPSFSPDLKLFVGNLPFSVDSAQLAELFENAGNVEMVEVIYDKETGRSRGFGFVTMSSVEEVEAAAQRFNGYELDGRALRVNSGPAPRRRDSPLPRMGNSSRGSTSNSSNRVFVGNLSWSVDDMALETLFSEQGKVLEAKVVYDRESGRSRGFGFVSYGSAEEVSSAIESLDGMDLDGRSIRVTVAESRPRRQF